MPNWSFNMHVIKGKSEDVLEFINSGIENSAEFIKAYGKEGDYIPTPKDDLGDAYKELYEHGCRAVSNHPLRSEEFNPDGDKPEVAEGISMSTFKPLPDTFLRYDTTNRAKEYPEIAKRQKREYGYIGWYDYNSSEDGFGTKWDAELGEFELQIREDEAIVSFRTETAWDVPSGFIKFIAEKFPKLKVYVCSYEESGQWYFYAKYGGEVHDWTTKINNAVNEISADGCGDWEERYGKLDELLEDMESEFIFYAFDDEDEGTQTSTEYA